MFNWTLTNQVCTVGVLMTSQCKSNDITNMNFLSQVNAIHGLWSSSLPSSRYSYLLQTALVSNLL